MYMPHMDADGMQTMQGSDYSDYEYQFINSQPGSPSTRSFGFEQQFEVLGGNGGLDNNEVAELVYVEVQASIEFEDEKADINVSTATELRGCIGANLNKPGGVRRFLEKSDVAGNDVVSQVGTEDRIFQQFQDRAIGPFDDETNGPGGGSVDGGTVYEKNFRDLTGRGPVLDSTDDFSLTGSVNSSDPISETIRTTVRIHLVWDVAEVSDAGQAFSVPGDD